GARSLRVGGCEQTRNRAAFRCAEDEGSLAAGGVHHSADVVCPLLEGCCVGRAIREAGAALVAGEKSAEAADPCLERSAWRARAGEVEVGGGARSEHEIDCTWPVT